MSSETRRDEIVRYADAFVEQNQGLRHPNAELDIPLKKVLKRMFVAGAEFADNFPAKNVQDTERIRAENVKLQSELERVKAELERMKDVAKAKDIELSMLRNTITAHKQLCPNQNGKILFGHKAQGGESDD